jgi:hypothetical protein
MTSTDKSANGASPTLSMIRAAIFSDRNLQRKSEIVEVWGVKMRLVQPVIGEMLGADVDGVDADLPAGMKNFLSLCLRDLYVPETDTHIFTIADIEQLKTIPWDKEINKLFEVQGRLSGVNVKEVEKNLEQTKPQSKS